MLMDTVGDILYEQSCKAIMDSWVCAQICEAGKWGSACQAPVLSFANANRQLPVWHANHATTITKFDGRHASNNSNLVLASGSH